MKKKLVSLNQQKFKPLSNDTKNLVRGGERTSGGCSVIKFERANGKDRDYVKEWSGDEADSNGICYFEVTYRWTGWY